MLSLAPFKLLYVVIVSPINYEKLQYNGRIKMSLKCMMYDWVDRANSNVFNNKMVKLDIYILWVQ